MEAINLNNKTYYNQYYVFLHVLQIVLVLIIFPVLFLMLSRFAKDYILHLYFIICNALSLFSIFLVFLQSSPQKNVFAVDKSIPVFHTHNYHLRKKKKNGKVFKLFFFF